MIDGYVSLCGQKTVDIGVRDGYVSGGTVRMKNSVEISALNAGDLVIFGGTANGGSTAGGGDLIITAGTGVVSLTELDDYCIYCKKNKRKWLNTAVRGKTCWSCE